MLEFNTFLFFILIVGCYGCVVNIENGEVNGTTLDTSNSSRSVCAYMGIPYAEPPIESLRFQPPKPAQPWGSLNATTFPNACPQSNEFIPPGVNMSEDCLYLNVYVPNIENPINLPVMIWIHGGGLIQGSLHEFTPSRLLARGDVILVTIQYRLGILGFLSTGDLIAPGNWGLKDQSFAIHWVSENIESFGGNPNQVTILGQSAGSAAVSFQLLSPLNAGVIHGAVAQSGVALASWALDKNPTASSHIMASILDCPVNSSEALVNCFRTTPWEKFIQAQLFYTYESYRNYAYPYAALSPVVEPQHSGAFITKEPLEIIKSGDFPDIPVMLGATKHDGSFVLANIWFVKLGPDGLDRDVHYMRDEFVPLVLKFFDTEEDLSNRAVSSSMELAYLAGVNRSSWDESMAGLVDLLSVLAIKSSVLNMAEVLSEKNSAGVYLYSFEHHSFNTMWQGFGTPVEGGIAHSDDLIYIFDYPNSVFTENDEKFSEIMCDMWINFATFGNPTPSIDSRYENWPKYSSSEELFMKLNVTPTVQTDYPSSWRPNGFDWS